MVYHISLKTPFLQAQRNQSHQMSTYSLWLLQHSRASSQRFSTPLK
nr:MAG TPA: hypothetical protein [Caudoviricetes sp.]